MLGIGDFAALGRVSVRMLRHYDAIGLLVPARTDPATGYRYYTADQLRRLNRLVALKDLGFTLEQVDRMLDDKVSTDELHGMLRLRRAQLAAQLAADTARLAGVESRLRMIEQEGRMGTDEVVLKPVPATRVVELSAVAASYENEAIGPVITPLYPELMCRIAAAGVEPSGLAVAYYLPAPDPGPDGQAVVVHAGIEVPADCAAGPDFDVVDLPPLAAAATIVHYGPMSAAGASFQTLARWIDGNGYRPVGYAREVCLHFDPHDDANWVHELQLEVTRG